LSAAHAIPLAVPVPVPAVEIIDVMSLSPMLADHRFLEAALDEAASSTRQWIVRKQADFTRGLSALRKRQFPLVLCDDALPWRDLLDGPIQELPASPLVIVTSGQADDRLWAEALNLGAYDVLAKPFERTEVIRAVESAWLHWHHRFQIPAKSIKVLKTAS
jgi:DNA-binding NtrC family response regulator